MIFTEHAKIRMQQRGFKLEHLKIITRFGVKRKIGDAYRYTLTKKTASLLQYTDIKKSVIEKCISTFVVICDDVVVTVAHLD